MSIFRGTLGSRADGALESVVAELVEPELIDEAGRFGDGLGIVFVRNDSGGPVDVTLPGIPDPYGRPGPVVVQVADVTMGVICVGAIALLGAPIVVEFSTVSGVLAGAFRLLDRPDVASILEPQPPDFWDTPDAAFSDSFEVPGWPGLEPPAEPFDFSGPDDTFSESFETSSGWDALAPPPEPFDFSTPDSSFSDSFETSAGWTNDP